MSWSACPVCSHNNPPQSFRCTSCAADFSDPDLMAMMSLDSEAGDAPDIKAGSLAHSKILGFSEDGLLDGTGVRKLAMLGLILLIAGFLLPVHTNYVDSTSAWNALEHASALTLLFPILAIVLGLVAFLAPLASWIRSALLIVAGTLGLATLPALGSFSGSPEKLLPLITLGTLLGGWGLVLRGLDAQSDVARRILIAGAAIAAVGYLIPMSDGGLSLPIELRLFLNGEIESGSALGVYSGVFNRSPMVFFSVAYLFLPLVILPAAAAIAYPKPTGAWDKRGLLLKPISWFIVLYVPIGFVLFLLNMLGSGTYETILVDRYYIPYEDFRSAVLSGRFRQLLLSTAFASWAVLPIVGLAKRFFSSAEQQSSDKEISDKNEPL